jgi:hypothetical protein
LAGIIGLLHSTQGGSSGQWPSLGTALEEFFERMDVVSIISCLSGLEALPLLSVEEITEGLDFLFDSSSGNPANENTEHICSVGDAFYFSYLGIYHI